jgi:hypothetical protein
MAEQFGSLLCHSVFPATSHKQSAQNEFVEVLHYFIIHIGGYFETYVEDHCKGCSDVIILELHSKLNICKVIVLKDWYYLCDCNTCRDVSGAISKCDSEA